MSNTLPEQYAYFADGYWLDAGQEPPRLPVRVQRDQTVTSFKGDEWVFKGVEKTAYGNSSGRVAVSRTCPDAYTGTNGVQDCPHMWHVRGIERQSFFPAVFELYLGFENGDVA